MKTTNKVILSSLALGGIVTIGAFTFAANSGTGESIVEGIKNGFRKNGMEKMFNRSMNGTGDMMRFGQMRGEGRMLGEFIDSASLSDEQKIALKTLQQTHMSEVKTLMESMKDASTDEEKAQIKTKMDELRKSHLEALKPYVSADKMNDFEEFIANGGQFGEGRGMMRGKMGKMHGRGENGLSRFIDFSSLTDDQKQALKDAKKNYLNSLSQYVSQDKKDEFAKYVEQVGNEEFEGGKGMMRGEGRMLGEFIDSASLSDEQKTALKTLQQSHMSEVKTLMESMKDASTNEAKTQIKTKMDELRKSHLEALKPYVSADKMTQFENFISQIGK